LPPCWALPIFEHAPQLWKVSEMLNMIVDVGDG
jgi:hypothetical protein